MADLKTDYKDDVFNGDRKYNLTENSDGTYSLVDVTSYTQEGDTFGADDINSTNTKVNELEDSIDDMKDITTATLTAGSTSISISDTRIKTNSVISFYSDPYGVNPLTADVPIDGKVNLTYDAQTSDVTVGVKVEGTYGN